jgi:hypothetical protein
MRDASLPNMSMHYPVSPYLFWRLNTVQRFARMAVDSLKANHPDLASVTNQEIIVAYRKHIPVMHFGEAEVIVFLDEARLMIQQELNRSRV